jgi:NADP-dependent aldehyde dehydrogenase
MDLTGLSIIGDRNGQRGGTSFVGVNPASGEPLPVEFHSAAPADVDLAARLADEAFPDYSRWPAKQRSVLLGRIADLLEADAAAIVERAHLETALPAVRLRGELARTCFQLRFYGEAAADGLCAGARIDHGDPDRKPQPKPDLRSLQRPIGPVAVFGAGNFPLAYSVAGGDTASALAAGCPVLVKAHPAHPGASEFAGRLLQQAGRECGAPAGFFSLLFDAGHEVGAALVRHPLVKAVGFTGSRRGGRALMDLAAARSEPIPVYAEMGSVNPVFVLAGALAQHAEQIAAALHGSVTLGVGQFCTNPGLVFVESGAGARTFLAKLQALMASTAPGTMLTGTLCAAYRAGVDRFSRIAGVNRAEPAADRVSHGPNQAAAALFTTDAHTFLATPGLMDEVFGPSTVVVHCASRAQMLAAARKLEGQLTASVHLAAEEVRANDDLLELLASKAGRLVFNGFPTGVEVAHAMTHGGPYPATSEGRSTSVGPRAIERFLRPVTYQNFPDAALPDELKESNPLGLWRLVDGSWRTQRDKQGGG